MKTHKILPVLAAIGLAIGLAGCSSSAPKAASEPVHKIPTAVQMSQEKQAELIERNVKAAKDYVAKVKAEKKRRLKPKPRLRPKLRLRHRQALRHVLARKLRRVLVVTIRLALTTRHRAALVVTTRPLAPAVTLAEVAIVAVDGLMVQWIPRMVSIGTLKTMPIMQGSASTLRATIGPAN